MKNIFVPLTGCKNDAEALTVAASVATRFEGRIEALHVDPDPMKIASKVALRQFVSRLGNIELIHALQKEAEERHASAVKTFEDFKRRNDSVSSGYRPGATLLEYEGDPVSEISTAARLYDLMVLARAPENGALLPSQIAAVLVACGRPMLLVPRVPERALGSTIAIAWKDTAETARAITAAMPFLSRADKIYVLHVPEPEHDPSSTARLASNLEVYGARVEARQVSQDECSGPEALLATAYGLGADLLVTGAYSHSRFGELVFGGYTRHLLDACEMPVLMLH